MSSSLKKRKTVSWNDTAKSAASKSMDVENKMLSAPVEPECDEESANLSEEEKHKHDIGHHHEIMKNLLITVEQVEVLYSGDIISKIDQPDPIVTISLQGVECQTKPVNNNKNPHF